MAEKTGIAWCDHTFNPWIGCSKVSPGCLNCYAESQNKFRKWNRNGWGDNAPRVRTSANNWKLPIKWAKQAAKDGVTRRVFCASLADVFDPLVPFAWLNDLWKLIGETEAIGGLEWLILTKRPHMIPTRIPADLSYISSSVRIGVTCEDQPNADKRLSELLRNWQGKNFVSYEPALGPVDFAKVMHDPKNIKMLLDGLGPDWIICGGESGPNARPMHPDWARSVRDQCQAAGVPFFLKQMVVDGKLVKEPELDGRQWLEFPKE